MEVGHIDKKEIVKKIECNGDILESLLQIVQDIQTRFIKQDRRMGKLEIVVETLVDKLDGVSQAVQNINVYNAMSKAAVVGDTMTKKHITDAPLQTHSSNNSISQESIQAFGDKCQSSEKNIICEMTEKHRALKSDLEVSMKERQDSSLANVKDFIVEHSKELKCFFETKIEILGKTHDNLQCEVKSTLENVKNEALKVSECQDDFKATLTAHKEDMTSKMCALKDLVEKQTQVATDIQGTLTVHKADTASELSTLKGMIEKQAQVATDDGQGTTTLNKEDMTAELSTLKDLVEKQTKVATETQVFVRGEMSKNFSDLKASVEKQKAVVAQQAQVIDIQKKGPRKRCDLYFDSDEKYAEYMFACVRKGGTVQHWKPDLKKKYGIGIVTGIKKGQHVVHMNGCYQNVYNTLNVFWQNTEKSADVLIDDVELVEQELPGPSGDSINMLF